MHGGTCLLYMKYQQIGIPPEEAQFLETRKFQLDEIARLYRIPPHMIGDLEKSSFNNIEQQSMEFVKYTLARGSSAGSRPCRKPCSCRKRRSSIS